MKICPDCAEELKEIRLVSHIYYRCYKCDVLFVEKGKGAYFTCKELTSFNELPENGRLPDICDECEKAPFHGRIKMLGSCSHYGYARHGCRSEEVALI